MRLSRFVSSVCFFLFRLHALSICFEFGLAALLAFSGLGLAGNAWILCPHLDRDFAPEPSRLRVKALIRM
jgi:hypothetical protein